MPKERKELNMKLTNENKDFLIKLFTFENIKLKSKLQKLLNDHKDFKNYKIVKIIKKEVLLLNQNKNGTFNKISINFSFR